MSNEKSKLLIVTGREYWTRVRKKSFLIMTILTPVLMVALIAGTYFLSTVGDDGDKTIAVIDPTGEYFPVLAAAGQYKFINVEGSFDEQRQKSGDGVYAWLVFSGDLIANPAAVSLFSERQVTPGVENAIRTTLNAYLSNKKLESFNIPDIKRILSESNVSIDLQTIRWAEAGKGETADEGKKAASSMAASVVGMIFTFLIYMFIMTYGGMVMQGVMEEKTNRIVEVIVSSVKPFDLMMGKLIGIGLVGLTQFGLWIALAFLVAGGSGFFGHSLLPSDMTADLAAIDFPKICFFFVLFFIGGYLIYASLYAAIGAIINSPEDAQQYMMPIMLLIIFAFYAGFYGAQNPDGPLAFWTSFIPFTSPVVMMIRLPFDVPLWQLLLSAVLLFGTVVGIIAIVAKIYRVGILMYGKKPTWGELAKWLKY